MASLPDHERMESRLDDKPEEQVDLQTQTIDVVAQKSFNFERIQTPPIRIVEGNSRNRPLTAFAGTRRKPTLN